jgi:4-amino-4-deoxy-L-arabinose transferase-like glycosyltransferase
MLLKSKGVFLGFLLAGLLLRLLFYSRFSQVDPDSLVYGDIAKNWLSHGIYGLTHADGPAPTWIRLPGYPLYLAICFLLFGSEHYHAVLLSQIVVDLLCCFVIADLARRAVSPRAGKFAFALATLCPFTAQYTALPLTETLAIFFTALTLDTAVAGFVAMDEGRTVWKTWLVCGLSLASGILLRPDGGILLGALGLFVLWRMWKRPRERARLFWVGALLLAMALGPLVPWTIRNWHDFHVFQPFAPRLASDLDEFTPFGFAKWNRTWVVEYVSTAEVWWRVPDEELDVKLLPARAYDTPQECDETRALFDEYNKNLFIGPELDKRFDILADQRIARHPIRYYVGLRLLRSTDMWLRPRTEMFDLNSRWWEFDEDLEGSLISVALGVLNLLFLIAALMGIIQGPRPRCLALMLLFVLLRSLFLGTMENPETRYTLECYPVVLVLAAGWISGWQRRRQHA